MDVDNYEPGKNMIPSCQLSAEFLSPTKGEKIPSLVYSVKLLGAKEPYNMFLIKSLTTFIGVVNVH